MPSVCPYSNAVRLREVRSPRRAIRGVLREFRQGNQSIRYASGNVLAGNVMDCSPLGNRRVEQGNAVAFWMDNKHYYLTTIAVRTSPATAVPMNCTTQELAAFETTLNDKVLVD